MKSKTFLCGIDVSKASLDVCFNDQANKVHYLKVNNDARGHALLINKLGKDRTNESILNLVNLLLLISR